MVSITKWIIIGAGMIMLGLFTKEASQTSLTGTLHRTGMAGGSIGSALSSAGSGLGDLFRGLFTPLWEVGNFAKSFGFGSDYWANSTPDPKAESQRIELTGQGGGFTDAETQGGGDPGVNTDPVSDTPGWFGWNQPAVGVFDVGGSNIKTSTITWPSGTSATLPLSEEATKWYGDLGVTVGSGTTQTIVGSVTPNNSGGGAIGGGGGSTLTSGNFGGTDTSHGWGF
jgi:hypothetical protein